MVARKSERGVWTNPQDIRAERMKTREGLKVLTVSLFLSNGVLIFLDVGAFFSHCLCALCAGVEGRWVCGGCSATGMGMLGNEELEVGLWTPAPARYAYGGRRHSTNFESREQDIHWFTVQAFHLGRPHPNFLRRGDVAEVRGGLFLLFFFLFAPRLTDFASRQARQFVGSGMGSVEVKTGATS